MDEHVKKYFYQAGIVALVLNMATMLVGFYSAKLFKIKDKRAIYSLLMFFTGGLVIYIGLKKDKKALA